MNTTAHRFSLSFGKLRPGAPCFLPSTAGSGVSDSEAASKEQSAASVLTLLQRGHLEKLIQIQVLVAPIILSRQEGWSKELTGLFHLEYLSP